ncbi:MAG TPA: hypothetical protein VKZ97_05645, partial [Flavobacteriaceae bacterium]|nr:hypothetical protein [Flavobacteriaceae bacterium]
MKLIALFLFISSMLISCQNDEQESQISWVRELDRMQEDFDKMKVLEDYSIVNDSLEVSRTAIYKKDGNGLYKIIDEVYHKDLMNFKREFYIQNGKIIKVEFSGFTRYIQKSKQTQTSNCCEHFKEIFYFKSPSEGLKFKKQLPVKDFEDIENRLKEFESLDSEKEALVNTEEEYNRFSDSIKKLKRKIE